MPRYRFFLRDKPKATEVVAESFHYEGDTVVFHNITEQHGEPIDMAASHVLIDGEVEVVE